MNHIVNIVELCRLRKIEGGLYASLQDHDDDAVYWLVATAAFTTVNNKLIRR